MPFDKVEGRHIVDTSLMSMRQVITRYGFLEKNSRVLVGISGGVDSLILVLLLLEYNKRFNQKWEIHACHIHPGFPGWNAGRLKKFFIKNNISYTIVKTEINKKVAGLANKCCPCARERRRKLLEIADKRGIFQIALAHHKQDVAETIFLNMIYNGEISTLVPKQSIIQGRFFFIRPLYNLDKEMIESIARIYGIPRRHNICPFYRTSKREVVRRFLMRIQKENPHVYKNIFRSIFHIKNTYMP